MTRLLQINSIHHESAAFFEASFAKADFCAHGWGPTKENRAFTRIIIRQQSAHGNGYE
jgi:hypothetical protein